MPSVRRLKRNLIPADKARIISIAIGLGVTYWIVDAFLMSLWLGEGSLYEELVSDPGPDDVWMRLSVAAVMIVFGLYIESATRGRRQVETALGQSEERFRHLAAAAFEGIAITEKGVILDANEQFAEMVGYDPAEVVGMHALELTAPESRDLVSQNIRSQYDKPYEHSALRKDGSIFPVEVCGKSMPYEGRSARVTAIRDITEGKRAEEALRDSQERFRSAFEHAAIGMALVRPDGRLFQVNPSLCQMLGYSEKELLATTWEAITHPDDVDVGQDQMSRMLAGEIESSQFEKRYFHRLGHEVWGLLSFSPVRDAAGSPLYFISQIQDISDRKQAEEALQKAREELEGRVEHQMLRRNPYGLTFRELTILHLVAAGESDRQVGITLGISHLTAQKHVSNILAKMEAASRTEAAARSVREGLLD